MLPRVFFQNLTPRCEDGHFWSLLGEPWMSMVNFGHFWKGLRLARDSRVYASLSMVTFGNPYGNIAVLRTFPFLTTRVYANLRESLDGHFWASLRESLDGHFL